MISACKDRIGSTNVWRDEMLSCHVFDERSKKKRKPLRRLTDEELEELGETQDCNCRVCAKHKAFNKTSASEDEDIGHDGNLLDILDVPVQTER